MAKTKTTTKTKKDVTDDVAKKALARAEKAVAAATEAVKDANKKLRKEAAILAKKNEKLAAKHADARRKLAEEITKAGVLEASAPEAPSPFTLPLPSPQPAAPTLIHLRQQAKAQNIPGYSRLNKAALIAALESSPQA